MSSIFADKVWWAKKVFTFQSYSFLAPTQLLVARCIAAAANIKKKSNLWNTFMQIHTAVAKCTTTSVGVCWSWSGTNPYHCHVSLLWCRAESDPGRAAWSEQNSRVVWQEGGERRLAGYREDLIVLWHPQNDIIAVWFHDNNNLQSSCINI